MGMKPEDIFSGPAVYYVKDYGQMAKKLGVGRDDPPGYRKRTDKTRP